MPTLYDRKSGQAVQIAPDQVIPALMSKRYYLGEGELGVVDPRGNRGTIDATHVMRAYQDGLRLESDEEQAERKYGGQGIKAFGLGALRGATASLSDTFLTEAGIVPKEELKGIETAHPGTSVVGEIGGAIAPALVSGGSTGAARLAAATPAGMIAGAGSKATSGVLNFFAKKTAEGAAKGILRESGERALAYAAGGATEGALFGTGAAVADIVIEDHEGVAETLIANAGLGALGGALGGGIVGGGMFLAGEGTRRLVGKGAKSTMGSMEAAEKEFRRMAEQKGMTEAFDHYGISPAQMEKLAGPKAGTAAKRKHIDLINETLRDETLLPDGAVLRSGDMFDESRRRLEQAVSHEGKAIGRFDDAADDIVKAHPELKKHLINGNDAIEEINRQLGLAQKIPGAESQVRFLEGLKKSWQNKSRTFKEWRELSSEYMARYKGKVDDVTGHASAQQQLALHLNDVRNLKLEKVLREAPNVTDDVVDTYMQAMKRYRALVGMESAAKLTQRSSLGASGMQGFAQGAGRGMLMRLMRGMPLGASLEMGALGGAMSSLSSGRIGQNINKMTVAQITARADSVHKMYEAAARTQGRLDKVSAVFAGGARAGRRVSARGMAAAYDKDERRGAQRLSERLHMAMADPAQLSTQVTDALRDVSAIDPTVGERAAEKVVALVEAAAADALQPRYASMIQPRAEEKWRISKTQAAEFRRIMQVLFDPVSIFEDAARGHVNPKMVMRVREHYPKLMEAGVQGILEKVAESKDPLPHSRRRSLTLLAGIPMEPLLQPKAIQRSQKLYAPPPKQGQGPQGVRQTGLGDVSELSTSLKPQSQRHEEVLT